jgi:hypothetical protein
MNNTKRYTCSGWAGIAFFFPCAYIENYISLV